MEAARTSETSVDNYFTRQYIPEDKPEKHKHDNCVNLCEGKKIIAILCNLLLLYGSEALYSAKVLGSSFHKNKVCVCVSGF
jgi:hypothetical protein